ncbi:MAG: hypothetical protein ACJAX5_002122, partial [Patiriisocius sp.]
QGRLIDPSDRFCEKYNRRDSVVRYRHEAANENRQQAASVISKSL